MRIPLPLLKGREFLAPKERLLVVQTDTFTAGAVFQKVDSLWYCVETAPILRWMMGKSPQEIKDKLSKMRARWQFLANANATEMGEDRTPSEREAPESLAGQTTADPVLKQLPDGRAGCPQRRELGSPQTDLKGVKPLDTASLAIVTSLPTVSRANEGVPPARPSVAPQSSLSE